MAPSRRVEVLWPDAALGKTRQENDNHVDDYGVVVVPASAVIIEDDRCASDGEESDRIATAVHMRDIAPPTRRVEVVWHDGAARSRIDDAQENDKQRTARRRPRRDEDDDGGRDGGRRRGSGRRKMIPLTDGERDGALLLAESFRVVASTFGVLADVVRFTGETAAATAGGASRVAGGVVRLSGQAIGGLGEVIEGGGGDGVDYVGEQLDDVSSNGRGEGGVKRRKRSRRVAGTSVRLLAGAIAQLADSLLLAGSATEHVAFAAAGAAEGTIRIMEDAAASLSDMFSREGMRSANEIMVPPTETIVGEVANAIDDEIQPDAVGAVTVDTTKEPPEDSDDNIQYETAPGIDILDFVRSLATEILRNAEIIAADTGGVPSLTYEMLGVFLLCFFASVVLLPSRGDERRNLNTGKIHSFERIKEEGARRPNDIAFDGRRVTSATNHVTDDHDSQSTLTVESTMKVGSDFGSENTMSTFVAIFSFLLLMPLRLTRGVLVLTWSIAFSKGALLFVLHIVGWIYLSWVAQYKSSVVQRKSEMMGYQLAIESMSEFPPSIKESAFWLNSVLSTVWRVGSGGLEPRISSSIRESLAETLSRPYSKPSAVAHVALNAFTFGSSPPIISRIELTGVDRDESVIFFNVDIGILLRDSVLLLDIKPSTLEYRSIPSTKVSINTLDAKATLDISIKCSPDYPYISFINISLVEIPAFSLRIEPQGESGLKGVDFGSFPVVSSWMKSSINAALSYYLTPHYISIDVLAWLNEDESVVKYFGY
ncbi:hypothetical protein ACHAXA_002736 [Cyclostephanos tholiformis]|uniref:SMP-LTD domain-containing protein n=1 Tax=Cyclostephanos tholiformis TaxID=382380 RepID=A0ABD3RDS8_9STRA